MDVIRQELSVGSPPPVPAVQTEALPLGETGDVPVRPMSMVEVRLALLGIGAVLVVASAAMVESEAERKIREANEAREAALKAKLADEAKLAENAENDATQSQRFMPKVNRRRS